MLGDEGLEDIADGHDAFADRNLALFVLKAGEVFDVHVEESRSDGLDGMDRINAGAGTVADIDTAADARIHVFDGLQDIEGGMPELVFRAVVMDGEADVILADEFFDERKIAGGGVAGNDDRDAGAPGVFEFGMEVGFVIGSKADGASGVQRNGSSGVVGKSSRFTGRVPGWVEGQMVFDIFCIERVDMELFHELDELGAGEIAEGITGEAEFHGGLLCGLRNKRSERGSGGGECSGLEDAAAGGHGSILYIH